MDIFLAVLTIIFSYLLGSVPFGLLVVKYAGKGDIRNIGSGNIGATNAMRTGNKKLGYATFALDSLKGLVAVLIAKSMGESWVVNLSAIAVILGHIYPIWLKFKGGKGVATAIAAYFGVFWFLGFFMCVCWYAIFKFSRMSSLASLVSITLTNVISLCFGSFAMFATTVIITVLVVYRHKENVMRILRSEENSFPEQ